MSNVGNPCARPGCDDLVKKANAKYCGKECHAFMNRMFASKNRSAKMRAASTGERVQLPKTKQCAYRGGAHSTKNVTWACVLCNRGVGGKHSKLLSEWRPELAELMPGEYVKDLQVNIQVEETCKSEPVTIYKFNMPLYLGKWKKMNRLESLKAGFMSMVNAPKIDGLEKLFMFSYLVLIAALLFLVIAILNGVWWGAIICGVIGFEAAWLMVVSLWERVDRLG